MHWSALHGATGGSNAEPGGGLQKNRPSLRESLANTACLRSLRVRTRGRGYSRYLSFSPRLPPRLRGSASKWNSTGSQRLRNQDDHLPRDLPSRLRNRLMDPPFVSRAPLEKPAAFLLRRPFSTNFSPRQCMHLPRSACGKLVHKPWRFRSVLERMWPPDRYPGSAFPDLRRRRAQARPVRPHFSH